MRKMRKKWVAVLCLSVCLCILSACGLVIGIWATVSMARAYPRPLDSFWSFDLSITIMAVSLLLFVSAVIGFIFCVRKLKSEKEGKNELGESERLRNYRKRAQKTD